MELLEKRNRDKMTACAQVCTVHRLTRVVVCWCGDRKMQNKKEKIEKNSGQDHKKRQVAEWAVQENNGQA